MFVQVKTKDVMGIC